MAILPYINFDGNAKEAILFYADVFQATPKIMYFKDMPEEGEVQMELQKTFWAPLYGMVKDRYGIIWQLSAEE